LASASLAAALEDVTDPVVVDDGGPAPELGDDVVQAPKAD